jgi:2-polyprenyl-6-methoxyphenol hydroxylase-like FAD-dependent oxidoreductase
VVVGGRVAGAATALLLARRGVRVRLLERAPERGTDTLSTLALMRAGVLQLDRWGLLGQVVAAGTPAVRRTTLHYGDDVRVLEVREKAGVGSLYAPRRTVLDPLLVAAAEEAGAEVRFGARVTGLLRDGRRVAGVTGRDGKGRDFSVRARLVVGADGVASRVAREVAAPVTWQGTASSACAFALFAGLPQEGYEWFYRPGASGGFIPTNDDLTLAWVGVPTDRFLAGLRHDMAAAFDRLLAEAAPEAVERVAAARRVGPLRGFPGLPGNLRQPWGPGWALVGDAGSFRDPLSAHGITDALRDAELLARAVVSGLAGDEEQEAAALAGYEARRDEVALPLALTTDAVASYRWTLAELEELLLELSRGMNRELEMVAALEPAGAVAA